MPGGPALHAAGEGFPIEEGREKGEVFRIDTTLQDGTVERRYYRADDPEQGRTPVTAGFTVEE